MLQESSRQPPPALPASPRRALLVGGLTALLASTCCLGPLLLLMLGFSGAWIGNLTLLEPYQPYLIGTSLMALLFAWRRIWRPATDCAPGEICALPQVKRSYKQLFGIVAVLVLLALVFPYLAPLFY